MQLFVKDTISPYSGKFTALSPSGEIVGEVVLDCGSSLPPTPSDFGYYSYYKQ